MKLLILLFVLLLTSCVKTKEPGEIKILMPNGAPSLSQVMIENEHRDIEGYKVTIDRVGDPKLLGPAFAGDDYSIIYAPINLGVKQYNTNKKFKVLASVTNGNIYFVSKSEIKSISDLNNKPLYLFGEKTINETIVNHILEKNNIKPSLKQFIGSSTQDTLKHFMTSKEDSVYLIAEPVLSAKLTEKNIKHYTLSINDLLKDDNISFIQAAVFYRDGIDTKFLDKYNTLLQTSINYVNSDSNVLEVLKQVNIGFPPNINMEVINRCNIKYTKLNKDILNPLINLDPKKFGGTPDEAFYN